MYNGKCIGGWVLAQRLGACFWKTCFYNRLEWTMLWDVMNNVTTIKILNKTKMCLSYVSWFRIMYVA